MSTPLTYAALVAANRTEGGLARLLATVGETPYCVPWQIPNKYWPGDPPDGEWHIAYDDAYTDVLGYSEGSTYIERDGDITEMECVVERHLEYVKVSTANIADLRRQLHNGEAISVFWNSEEESVREIPDELRSLLIKFVDIAQEFRPWIGEEPSLEHAEEQNRFMNELVAVTSG